LNDQKKFPIESSCSRDAIPSKARDEIWLENEIEIQRQIGKAKDRLTSCSSIVTSGAPNVSSSSLEKKIYWMKKEECQEVACYRIRFAPASLRVEFDDRLATEHSGVGAGV
jgi:hypothetical protein